MSTDAGQQRVYADLVAGLLDARDDPATDRFDEELAAAVERGDLSADLARRLRFWQRAAVRSLTDHSRTVLPAALGALAAARQEDRTYVEELARTIDPVGADAQDADAQDADAQDADAQDADTPGPASSVPSAPRSSLETPSSRLLVADLVLTPPTARTGHV
jgi:hypothetical protein